MNEDKSNITKHEEMDNSNDHFSDNKKEYDGVEIHQIDYNDEEECHESVTSYNFSNNNGKPRNE